MRALTIAIVGLAMVAVGAMASEWEWGLRIYKGDVAEEHALTDIDSLTFFELYHPGACCFEDGSCLTTTSPGCEGDWLGVGTTCKPNPCPQPPIGACCYEDGSCLFLNPAECDGDWLGMGTVCDPNPCPQPVRVCCLPGDHCVLMTEYHCLASNGTWYFHLSSCDPNPCPVHPGEMIWIPSGNVRLGQAGIAEPVHDVWVDGFWIRKYEVTNGEYAAFIAAGGYTNQAYWNPVGWAWRVENDITLPAYWNENTYHGGGIPGNEGFPVNGVSWWEADAYCRWAGKRLPTEAEWEKAAKGGCEMWGDPAQCDAPSTPTYPWGGGISGQRANFLNSGDPYENSGKTTPVGYYDGSNHGGYQTIDSPSPYGLYDVAGNVFEWTSTKFASYPYNANDGREDPPSTFNECCRVLRGGSWSTYTIFLRCAFRYYNNPDIRYLDLGFRCASN